MASNYEQPKLATSKQYNVSQGNIGQVKQYTTDWSDYESAKVWEEVAKGTGKVNESIQESAKLRGMLDQTGNLVAQNSWLTEDSYNQGRAAVIAEQQKGKFLEIVDRTAREVAQKNGTMEDYNKAIEPYYQEYIKNIRNVTTVDVNGNPLSIELQNETLVNARKEMITYVALGQQKFQKIKEEQNEIDRQDLNGNMGSNLIAQIQNAASAKDIPTLIAQFYTKVSLVNSQYGDPTKARALTDALTQETLTQVLSQGLLDPNKPLDVQKADVIAAVIDTPGFNLNPTSKGKIREEYTKFVDKHKGVIKWNLNDDIAKLNAALDAGVYNPKDYAALAAEIKRLAQNNDLTWEEAITYKNKLDSLNGKVSENGKKDPDRILNLNQTGALGEYADLTKHAEAAYKAIAQRVHEAGGTVSQVNEMFFQWASQPERQGIAAYTNFLASKLADNFKSDLPVNLSITPPDEERITNTSNDDMKTAQWQQLVSMTAKDGNFNMAAARALGNPKYIQAFTSLSISGKFTGNYVQDVKLLVATAANNDAMQEMGEVAIMNYSTLSPEFFGMFSDDFRANQNWWNGATKGTLNRLGGYLRSMVKTNPAIVEQLRAVGVMHFADAAGLQQGFQATKHLITTGDFGMVSTSSVPLMKIMQKGTEASEEEVLKAIDVVIWENVNAAQKGKAPSIFADRNYLLVHDGAKVVLEFLDDAGNLEPGISPVIIENAKFVSAVTTIVGNRTAAQANQSFPVHIAEKGGGTHNLTINTSQLYDIIGNSQVAWEYVRNILRGESLLKSGRQTMPDMYPDVWTTGAGVTKKSYPAQYAAINEGFRTGNMQLVNKAHTEVFLLEAAKAKKYLNMYVGAEPKEWDGRQRLYAQLILDSTYVGGVGAVKDKDGKVIHIGTAAALDKGLKSGMSALSIIETFPKAFQNHLKDKTGALNQRGLWWANNIKVMQNM
jgi:hypothetical protein